MLVEYVKATRLQQVEERIEQLENDVRTLIGEAAPRVNPEPPIIMPAANRILLRHGGEVTCDHGDNTQVMEWQWFPAPGMHLRIGVAVCPVCQQVYVKQLVQRRDAD